MTLQSIRIGEVTWYEVNIQKIYIYYFYAPGKNKNQEVIKTNIFKKTQFINSTKKYPRPRKYNGKYEKLLIHWKLQTLLRNES